MEISDLEYLKALKPDELEYVINNLPVEQVEEILSILEDEEVEEKPAKKVRKARTTHGPDKIEGTPTQKESIKLVKNRPNKFLTSPDFHAEKHVKTTWIRPPEKTHRPACQIVAVECGVCGKTCEIPASLMPPKNSTFKCNNCY